MKHVLALSDPEPLVSTELDEGTARFPLPAGERAGVRGFGPMDSV
jgi:hypothetical protein